MPCFSHGRDPNYEGLTSSLFSIAVESGSFLIGPPGGGAWGDAWWLGSGRPAYGDAIRLTPLSPMTMLVARMSGGNSCQICMAEVFSPTGVLLFSGYSGTTDTTINAQIGYIIVTFLNSFGNSGELDSSTFEFTMKNTPVAFWTSLSGQEEILS